MPNSFCPSGGPPVFCLFGIIDYIITYLICRYIVIFWIGIMKVASHPWTWPSVPYPFVIQFVLQLASHRFVDWKSIPITNNKSGFTVQIFSESNRVVSPIIK